MPDLTVSLPSRTVPVKTHAYWISMAVAAAAVLALAATANIIADPFGIYGTGKFPPVTINQYANKRTLFEHYLPPPSSLIIGSSRVQCLDPDVVTGLTGRSCFNWELPGAKTEISYATLQMALQEFDAPVEMVIVGVEPEAFQPIGEIDPQARLTPGYTKYFSDETPWTLFQEKTGRLFSMDQSSVSALVLLRAMLGMRTKYWITWGPDGFAEINWENHPDYVIDDPARRLQYDIEMYPEQRWRIEEFTGLSDKRKGYWEDFLSICAENGIEVYAFTPPDHPALIENLIELGAGPVMDETRRYLEETVTAVGGTYMDYTRLESFGGREDGFRDAIHMTPENGELLLRNLLAGYENTTNPSIHIRSR